MGIQWGGMNESFWGYRYWLCVAQAQKHMNLTAWQDYESWWHWGVEPSLKFVEKIPESASVIDIGSGSGLPGLVIAILRPHCQVTLVEPRAKRASFLRMTALTLGCRVSVLTARAQCCTGHFDYISSRAVADPETLMRWTEHLAHEHTRWVLHRPAPDSMPHPWIDYVDYDGL